MMRSAVAIGDSCVSWVLSHRGNPLRPIALATRRAAESLNNNHPLQQALRASPAEKYPAVLHLAGFEVETLHKIEEWTTFGIHLFTPEIEFKIYSEGKHLLLSGAEGVHRRVYFAISGISTPEQLDDLQPNLYAAMLARIAEAHQDPSLQTISAIGFSDHAFDTRAETDEGLKIIFSLPMLKKWPRWSHLTGIGLHTIKGANRH